jgi:predicted extracellular nuclease
MTTPLSKYLFGIFIFLFLQTSLAQQTQTIAFYNVENLFDTIDGSNDDAEFLPGAESKWNTEKYQTKLQHIRQVMTDLQMPMVMGVCEIENKAVLQDLIAQEKRYGIVHYDSPDARGIDAALLYRKDLLKLKASGNIRFTLPGDTIPTSRDIVWAKFQYQKETIYVVVNHWPSRRGGADESAPRRLKAAEMAADFISKIEKNEPKAKIILMGDLNDHPQDAAPQLIASKLSPQLQK